MTAQGKNSRFPDKDIIKKYLQGKLSPEEAHRIEKLVLNDPFYQDAMEGIDSLDAVRAKKDIEDLSDRIKRRSHYQKRKNIVIYRIAAAVILLAILSYTLILTTDRLDKVSNKETVSQKLEVSEDTPPATMKSEKVGAESKEAVGPVISEIKTMEEKDDRSITPEIGEPETDRALDMDKDISSEEPISEIAEISVKPAPKYEILEEETETAPQIEIMEEETTILSAQNDLEEEILLEEREGLTKSSEETTPMRSNTIESTKTRKRESQDPQSKSAGYAPEISNAQDTEEFLKAEPVIGFDAYKQYIKDNLNYPADAIENGIEGFVELAFIVNKDSIPSKIEIIKSLSRSCDKEAKRLLKDGPKWKPLISDGQLLELEVRYTLTFELKE